MADWGELAAELARQPLLGDAKVAVRGDGLQIARGEDVVLVADVATMLEDDTRSVELLTEVSAGRAMLVAVGETTPSGARALLAAGVFDVRESRDAARLAASVRNALDMQSIRTRAAQRAGELRRYRYELGEMIEIARSISLERDIDALLHTILERTRYITAADAGSIYVVEGKGKMESRSLRFKLSQNDSLHVDSREFVMPLSRSSLAGAAALERRIVNVPDVSALTESGAHHHTATFDQRTGYRTRSVLSAPMIAHSGEVIGVVQLINRKSDPAAVLLRPEDFESLVEPFNPRCEELVRTLSAHAAVSLENALLYDNIRRIFEGLVTASVHAIEQRDPTTSGHSERVAELTCRLAESVNRDETAFAGVALGPEEMLELRYAALLHDFGKIGVREELLLKARRLHARVLETIRERLEAARLSRQREHLERRIALAADGATEAALEAEDASLGVALLRLDEAHRTIIEANEAGYLDDALLARVDALEALSFATSDGSVRPLLDPAELSALRVRRGSLTAEEYAEICAHASKTTEFLSRIPWGEAFAALTLIAGSHHERLDGTGYPAGLAGDRIPLQARMMSVADIYDALTAADRPYKRAVPPERAIEILRAEAKAGHLDAELVDLFASCGLGGSGSDPT
jgi:HD-GYP domain-containing protein (c-di-GMP phosphodiesterase class II)